MRNRGNCAIIDKMNSFIDDDFVHDSVLNWRVRKT